MKFKNITKLLVITIFIEIFLTSIFYMRSNKEYCSLNKNYILDKIFNTKVPAELSKFNNLGCLSSFNSHKFYKPDALVGYIPRENNLFTDNIHGQVPIHIVGPQNFFLSDLRDNIIKLKNDKTFRIILLGGSNVAGIGTSGYKYNLASQIKKELKKTIKKENFEILNAGVPGYYSEQIFLQLIYKLKTYNPDLLILHHGWNDSQYFESLSKLNSNNELFINREHVKMNYIVENSYSFFGSLKLFIHGTFRSLNNGLNKFATHYYIRRSINKISEQVNSNLNKNENLNTTNINDLNEYFEKRYKNALRNIIALSKEINTKIIISTEPIMGVDNKLYSKQEEKIFQSLTKKQIEDRKFFYNKMKIYFKSEKEKHDNVCFHDLSNNIFRNIAQTTYVDSGHLNDLGTQLVSKKLINLYLSCF